MLQTKPRRWLALIWLAVLILPIACNSTGANRDHLRDCECGTAKADTMGCRSECALDGGTACENPECTCDHEGAYKQADSDKQEGK